MKNILRYSTLTLAFPLSILFFMAPQGCKKTTIQQTIVEDTTRDKQIMLEINEDSYDNPTTTPVTGGLLLKFRKTNYVGVDSIIFVCNPSVNDTANYSMESLYDRTDGITIPGSTLSSDKLFLTFQNNDYPPGTYFQSGNLYNSLPDKEIDLGFILQSKTNGKSALSGNAYLFLYRK